MEPWRVFDNQFCQHISNSINLHLDKCGQGRLVQVTHTHTYAAGHCDWYLALVQPESHIVILSQSALGSDSDLWWCYVTSAVITCIHGFETTVSFKTVAVRMLWTLVFEYGESNNSKYNMLLFHNFLLITTASKHLCLQNLQVRLFWTRVDKKSRKSRPN